MVRQVTGKQRATQHLGDLVPQLGSVTIWDQEWSSGLAHMWTEATSLVSLARHANQRNWMILTQAPKEEHRNTTLPQPRSSFLALLVKYAWHIKIIVQTEGLTVAQSRPGRCLDHSVGGATARRIWNVPGVGIETTPGNGTVGNNLHISGHGRFWNCICSPAFLPVK